MRDFFFEVLCGVLFFVMMAAWFIFFVVAFG